MVLTPCRECGEDVSDAANTCPHCGIKSPGKVKSLGWFGKLAIAFVLLFVIGTLAYRDPQMQQQLRAESPCNTSAAQQSTARALIQHFGYDCAVVDQMCHYVTSEGFTVYCNHLRYTFEIENHGAKWSVHSD
jgi:hypothetical protein